MHIRAENLVKTFDNKTVIKELSFEAYDGHVLGILGASGAGKTTIIRILLGLIKPDQGIVYFNDAPLDNHTRNILGYLPQQRGLYAAHTVKEVLTYCTRIKKISRQQTQLAVFLLLNNFEIIEYLNTPIGDLPPLVQQKIQIILPILHNPEILVLDEPFRGLAPENQELFSRLIQQFKSEGKTIILGMKNLKEAEQLCDEVIVLHKGEALIQGELQKIFTKYQEPLIRVEGPPPLKQLERIRGVKKLILDHHSARLYLESSTIIQEVLKAVFNLIDISRVEIIRPNLHEIFFEIFQESKKGNS